MGYIVSDNIIIFPTSNRLNGSYNGTNWLTEHNIANITDQLNYNKGFVISPREKEEGYTKSETTNDYTFDYNGSSTTPFEFNIAGYYVKTTIGAISNAITSNDKDKTKECCSLINFTSVNNTDSTDVYAFIKTLGPQDAGSLYSPFQHLDGEDRVDKGEIKPSVENINNKLLLFTVKGSTGTIPATSRIHLPHLVGTNIEDLGGAVLGRGTLTIGPTGTLHFIGGQIEGNISANITGSTINYSNSNINYGTGSNINGGNFNGITIGPSGTTQSKFAGQLDAPTGTLGAVTFNGTVNANNQNINGGNFNGKFAGQLLGPTGTLGAITLNGTVTATGQNINGGNFNGVTIGPSGSTQSVFNGGSLNGVTIGPLGDKSSTFAGVLNGPTGILGHVMAIGPTGATVIYKLEPAGPTGSIVATAIKAQGSSSTVIPATEGSKTDSNNLALLFKFDDGTL